MIKLKIITIFLIAVSLSMDAFSLALIYGTQGITKKDKVLLSLIVGIYHFIMPLIGVTIGNCSIGTEGHVADMMSKPKSC